MNIRSFLTIDGNNMKNPEETLNEIKDLNPEKIQNEIKDLNPEKIQNELEKFIPKVIQYGMLLLLAIIIYFIGRKILKAILKMIEKSIKRSNMEASVAGFLMAVIRVILHGLLIILIIGMVGVDTSSLAALVGSAGLAVGLAIQGSLSNFAGGVLILLMKPFRAGDYIVTDTYEGTVSSIDIFYTRLITGDNRLVVIPNGTLSNSNIINVTSKPVRRLDLLVGIDYQEDIGNVKEILLNVIKSEKLVKKDSEICVFVNDLNQSSISLGIRFWVDTDDYWTVKCDILEKIKKAFDENNIQFPYNKMDILVNDHRK